MGTLTALLSAHGVAFAAIVVFLSQLGLPVPGTEALLIAGAFVSDGRVSGILLLLGCAAASTLADLAWFTLGRRHGELAHRVASRLVRARADRGWPAIPPLERLGAGTLIVLKFIPPGPAVVFLPVMGASPMRVTTFLLVDTLGSVLWAGGGILLGMAFHSQIQRLLALLSRVSTGALVLAAVLLVVWAVARLGHRRWLAKKMALRSISPCELAERLAGADPPNVLDVRSEASRSGSHRVPPGARTLRLESLEEDLAWLPRDREVVLLFDLPGDESIAARTVVALRERGFRELRRLEGGVEAWEAISCPMTVVPAGGAH